jgi:hypothetical protein
MYPFEENSPAVRETRNIQPINDEHLYLKTVAKNTVI